MMNSRRLTLFNLPAGLGLGGFYARRAAQHQCCAATFRLGGRRGSVDKSAKILVLRDARESPAFAIAAPERGTLGETRMAISQQAQQLKDELFAILARLNIGMQQLLAGQPELATEIGMTTDVLTRELKGLIRRAQTIRDCINAARTIAKVLRETADEFEAI
jgi:hypothetical protein